MIVDKIWKLTNVVRVRLAPRSSHSQRYISHKVEVMTTKRTNLRTKMRIWRGLDLQATG